jgi:putative transposase
MRSWQALGVVHLRLESTPDKNAAIIAAHATGGYSYQQIAEYFGMHFTSVGRILRGGRE